MKKKRIMRVIYIVVFTIVLGSLVTATSQIFLRNFYQVISFDEKFSAIFKQISDAEMSSPVIAVITLSFVYGLVEMKFGYRSPGGRILTITIFPFAWIILGIFSVCFTKINDILVLDIVISLLPVLWNGGL